MSVKYCCRCGSAANGKLDSIRVTCLCVNCCRDGSRSHQHIFGCFHIVSEKQAIEEFEVTQAALSHLRYLKLREETDSGSIVSKYYLTGEVRYLRNLRRKKEKIEREMGIDLKALDPRIRNALLSSDLSVISEAEMSQSLSARCSVLKQVQQTLQRCPWEHPETLFEFYVQSPSAEPEDFEHMKKSMAAVFEIEGHRILHAIPDEDRSKLENTPLAEVYASFNKRDSDAVLRGYLGSWFAKDTVKDIMKEAAWRSRPWAKGPEDRVAMRLRQFWIERTRRKDILDQALDEIEVCLAEDSMLYSQYVNGETRNSSNDVVALADLSYQLEMQHNIEIDSAQGQVAALVMFKNLNICRTGHVLSVKRGIDAGINHTGRDVESDAM